MDHQKLRALVFEKTGIKIDEQDPVFALVALNDAVLEETVARHLASLNEAGERIKAQTRFLMQAGERYRKIHAGEPLGAQNLAGYESWSGQNPAAAARPAPAIGAGRLIGAVLAASLLSACLAAGGFWLIQQNTPGPAPVAMAPAPAPAAAPAPLTPTQLEMIRIGEKFSRAMLNLDENTRALIQTEMDKP